MAHQGYGLLVPSDKSNESPCPDPMPPGKISACGLACCAGSVRFLMTVVLSRSKPPFFREVIAETHIDPLLVGELTFQPSHVPRWENPEQQADEPPAREETASAPSTKHGTPLLLQASPEAHMKRLLVAKATDGATAIYQITRSFRGGERGRLQIQSSQSSNGTGSATIWRPGSICSTGSAAPCSTRDRRSRPATERPLSSMLASIRIQQRPMNWRPPAEGLESMG